MIRIGMVLVGFLVFLYGFGAFGLSLVTDMNTTVEWYKSVAGCIFSGITLSLVGIYGNKIKDKVMSLIPDKKEKTTQTTIEKDKPMDETKKESPVNQASWNFLIENYDHLDSLAKSLDKEDDKNLCRNLQKRLLEIHHEKSCAEKK